MEGGVENGVREEEDEYERRAGEGYGELTLKPLISHRQTPSLCQGVSQSEGQGLGVPLAGPPPPPPPSLRVGAYRRLAALLKPFSLGPK